MSRSNIGSDPAMGDVADLNGDLDALARRSAGYADGPEYAGFWIRVDGYSGRGTRKWLFLISTACEHGAANVASGSVM